MAGSVLLAAAGLKADQVATVALVAGWSGSHLFLIAQIAFELLLGLWLLSGAYPRQARGAAIFCFVAFAGFSLAKGLAGRTSCGCFGNLEVSPWWSLSLNVALVAALMRCHAERPSTWDFSPRRRLLLMSVAACISIGVPAAMAMSRNPPATLTEDGQIVGYGGFVVLEPEKWLGRRFPLLPWIDVGPHLGEGEWLVLLYHHDCGKCQELLPRYYKAGTTGSKRNGPGVALIEIPPYAAPAPGDFHAVLPGRLLDKAQWIVRTPVEVRLSAGFVASVATPGQ
ncbi:MAG: MauE/DoxX family redox-associated membrane protein [Pirellulales bacterium]